MSKRRWTRRGAYAGGGLALGTVGLLGVLAVEAAWTMRIVHKVELQRAPNPSGWYGARRPGRPITIALLGDSSAAGYGMTRAQDAPGAVLATGASEKAGRPVLLHDLSVIGAKSSDLGTQVDAAIEHGADVAVILVGANDVVRRVRPSVAVAHLERAVTDLRTAGVTVIVGTVPDLGTMEPLFPPLRQVMRWWSRRLAAEQTYHVLRAGGRTVSLADILGPEFVARPRDLLGPDLFHPSAQGYAALADVLLPSTLAALGLLGDEEAVLETYRGLTVVPVAAAALRAINHPGTELDPAPRPRGHLGRTWVSERKFEKQEHAAAEAPVDERAQDEGTA